MAISDIKLYCNIIFTYTYYTLESNFYVFFQGLIGWINHPLPSTYIQAYTIQSISLGILSASYDFKSIYGQLNLGKLSS